MRRQHRRLIHGLELADSYACGISGLKYPLCVVNGNVSQISGDPLHRLIHGQLPSVYTQPDPASYLASYVEYYLRQEVLEEGRTRNLAAFSRFLDSASFSQAAPSTPASLAEALADSNDPVVVRRCCGVAGGGGRLPGAAVRRLAKRARLKRR